MNLNHLRDLGKLLRRNCVRRLGLSYDNKKIPHFLKANEPWWEFKAPFFLLCKCVKPKWSSWGGHVLVLFCCVRKKASASSRCVLAGKDLIGWRRRVIALLRGRKKHWLLFSFRCAMCTIPKPVVAQEPCVPWRNKGRLRSECQRSVEEDIDLFRHVDTTHSALRTFQVCSRKYTCDKNAFVKICL